MKFFSLKQQVILRLYVIIGFTTILSLTLNLNFDILDNVNAQVDGIDPLGQVDFLSDTFTSSLLPSSGNSLLPIILAIGLNNGTGNGPFDEILNNALENLNDFFDSKSLGEVSSSTCLASAFTGGSGEIKKRGVLIIGTACDDKIEGSEKDEIIYTLGGADRVFAEQGHDVIYSGSGSSRLYGEQGNDIIVSGGGSNLVDGGPGDDVLLGGSGGNLLVGGTGDDELIAGIGTTIMDGGDGTNSFDCGTTGMVLDYNPENGDTIAGECKIVNNLGKDLANDLEDDIPDGD